MIVRESGSGTRRVLSKALQANGLELSEHFHLVAEIGNTVGIIGALKCGLGVSILSTRAIEEELKSGALLALDIQHLDLERQIHLVVDKRRTISPLAGAFRHYITQRYANNEVMSKN
jgi:DNA-binding transcriptional LysR family regulator